MLAACTRIEHPFCHFVGFSQAVAGRIIDSKAKLVITADEGLCAGRAIPLKKNVDDALNHADIPPINHVVVFRRTDIPNNGLKDGCLVDEIIQGVSTEVMLMDGRSSLYSVYFVQHINAKVYYAQLGAISFMHQ